MSSVTERDRRAATAASAVALAYLRLVTEGDSSRALPVLAEFQHTWNVYVGDVVREIDPGVPDRLAVKPTYDAADARAMVGLLVGSGWLPEGSTMPGSVEGLPAVYRSLAARLPGSWPVYELAATNPTAQIRTALSTWVFEYIEGFGESDDAWLDELAGEAGWIEDNVDCGDGFIRSGSVCVYDDALVIEGGLDKGRQQPIWPWVIGAGVLAAAAIGLAPKRKSRRRKR